MISLELSSACVMPDRRRDHKHWDNTILYMHHVPEYTRFSVLYAVSYQLTSLCPEFWAITATNFSLLIRMRYNALAAAVAHCAALISPRCKILCACAIGCYGRFAKSVCTRSPPLTAPGTWTGIVVKCVGNTFPLRPSLKDTAEVLLTFPWPTLCKKRTTSSVTKSNHQPRLRTWTLPQPKRYMYI